MESTKWEYRIVTGDNKLTEDALNQLGSEGWEMVGMSSHAFDSPLSGGTRVQIICVFKRAKR